MQATTVRLTGSEVLEKAVDGDKFSSPAWFINQKHFEQEKFDTFIQKVDGKFIEMNLLISKSHGDDFSFSIKDKKAIFEKIS